MKTIHRTLHLQHHAHTGKRLHHRHTSYRGLAIIIMLALGFVIGLNNLARVTANSLYVYATNPAPIPTAAAVITGPAGGNVSEPQTTITGTCPAITPHVIVEILLDGFSVGSAACDDTNTFSLPITISSGQHSVVARIYTITGDTGTDSQPFVLYATFPTTATVTAPVGTSEDSSTPNTSVSKELSITPTSPFIVFGPAKDAIWEGTVSGGTLPYTILLNWGDDTTDTITLKSDGLQSFTHRYKAMHSYTIALQVTDADGSQIIRYYTAVTPYVASGSSNQESESSAASGSSNSIVEQLRKNAALVGAYTTLLTTIVLFAVLWHHNQAFMYAKVPTHRTFKPNRRKPAHSHR